VSNERDERRGHSCRAETSAVSACYCFRLSGMHEGRNTVAVQPCVQTAGAARVTFPLPDGHKKPP